jgi:hypothetical protein
MKGAASQRLRAGLLLAAIGAAALVWTVRQAGTDTVIAGVERIGGWIVVIWLLGGFRAVIRTAAWRLCLEPHRRVGFGSMFSAYLVGDAIGNVTPFGLLISEPSKIVLLRGRAELPSLVAALAVENLFYSATVVVMLVAGTVALLTFFAVPAAMRDVSIGILALTLAFAAAAAWIVAGRRRPVTGAIEWLVRRGIGVEYWGERLPRVRETGDRIFGFAARGAGVVAALIALETAYHAAAVAEIWFAIALITTAAPGVMTAFVLEYVNRAITAGFQFVPMWLGVDEAGTSLATGVLGLGAPAGVSLALARKTRNLVWTAIGLGLFVRRGLTFAAVQKASE